MVPLPLIPYARDAFQVSSKTTSQKCKAGATSSFWAACLQFVDPDSNTSRSAFDFWPLLVKSSFFVTRQILSCVSKQPVKPHHIGTGGRCAHTGHRLCFPSICNSLQYMAGRRSERRTNNQNRFLRFSLSSGTISVQTQYDWNFARLGQRFAIGDGKTPGHRHHR